LWGSVFLLGDGPFPLDITSPFPHLQDPYLCCGQLQQMTQWNWRPELCVMSSQTTNGLFVIKWTWSKKSKESWQWTCETLNACYETPWVTKTCWWRIIMCDWLYL
jgi:hypothetical protein